VNSLFSAAKRAGGEVQEAPLSSTAVNSSNDQGTSRVMHNPNPTGTPNHKAVSRDVLDSLGYSSPNKSPQSQNDVNVADRYPSHHSTPKSNTGFVFHSSPGGSAGKPKTNKNAGPSMSALSRMQLQRLASPGISQSSNQNEGNNDSKNKNVVDMSGTVQPVKPSSASIESKNTSTSPSVDVHSSGNKMHKINVSSLFANSAGPNKVNNNLTNVETSPPPGNKVQTSAGDLKGMSRISVSALLNNSKGNSTSNVKSSINPNVVSLSDLESSVK
jgi:hypothetical protein